MPGRKAKKDQPQEEDREETPPAQTETETPSLIDQRLSKIEEAIARMAEIQAKQAPLPQPPEGPTTRGRAKTAKKKAPSQTRRSVSMDPALENISLDNTHSSIPNADIPAHPAPTAQASDAPHVSARARQTRQPARPDLLTPQPADPLSTFNKPQLGDPVPDVNKPQLGPRPPADPWAQWMLPAQPTGQYSAHMPFQAGPPMAYGCDQDEMEQQVHHILASTAHSLTRGNVKPGAYPYKYIFRGPDKKRATINSVTLPEHLWGLVRMIKDPTIDPSTRPALINHMEEIIEDSCEYEWVGIRRWSEEVFSLLAENRLANGWGATHRIQMLRMTLARIPLGQFQPQKEFQPRRQFSPVFNNNNSSEATRGGPPCHAYNSQAGCNQPSGHLVNGRRMLHVCTYCLLNSSVGYTHPESQCRNKSKFAGQHF